jgi:hypothetical protein
VKEEEQNFRAKANPMREVKPQLSMDKEDKEENRGREE